MVENEHLKSKVMVENEPLKSKVMVENEHLKSKVMVLVVAAFLFDTWNQSIGLET